MKTQFRLPYIGVTGFMTKGEVDAVTVDFDGEQDRQLMVGVLASSKTLAGLSGKWPGRYPNIAQAPTIFSDHPSALNLFHYATSEPDGLESQLFRLWIAGGPLVDGFQLNMAWPSVRDIANFVSQPDTPKRIVLQLGRKALEVVNNRPRKLTRQLRDYLPYVTDVLIDLSGGTGKPLITSVAKDYLRELRESCPLLGLGVAGGLSADTLYLVEPLIDEFPDLSIDAEGRLRTGDDRLSLDYTSKYVAKSLRMFDQHL